MVIAQKDDSCDSQFMFFIGLIALLLSGCSSNDGFIIMGALAGGGAPARSQVQLVDEMVYDLNNGTKYFRNKCIDKYKFEIKSMLGQDRCESETYNYLRYKLYHEGREIVVDFYFSLNICVDVVYRYISKPKRPKTRYVAVTPAPAQQPQVVVVNNTTPVVPVINNNNNNNNNIR